MKPFMVRRRFIVHRYITAFKQVLLCRKRGLPDQEIAFAVKMSLRLVQEYQNLITELTKSNPLLDQIIEQLDSPQPISAEPLINRTSIQHRTLALIY